MSTTNTKNRKEFWLSTFAINNRISVLVLVALVAIMGILSYLTIPKESFPNITVPNIFVVTFIQVFHPKTWKVWLPEN